MSLAEIAKVNLEIFRKGFYTAPSGKTVWIAEALEQAKRGTRLYTPEMLTGLLDRLPSSEISVLPSLSVTPESTGAALRRLVVEEGNTSVLALNFASARNPGGGFLHGAKAQEEALCRATGLYPCLLTQPRYYEAHRKQRSALYTDHLIYSPEVPFLRDEQRHFLEEPFTASFLTAPAPNAGAVLQNAPDEMAKLPTVYTRRARMVLAVAVEQGHRVLVLGAWGCGAFRNDAAVVAPLWKAVLEDGRFQGAFDRVILAIYCQGKDRYNLDAFAETFNVSCAG